MVYILERSDKESDDEESDEEVLHFVKCCRSVTSAHEAAKDLLASEIERMEVSAGLGKKEKRQMRIRCMDDGRGLDEGEMYFYVVNKEGNIRQLFKLSEIEPD